VFEKLVVSTSQRRKRRTSRFFLGTVFVYVSAVVIAFALSISLSSPQLADSNRVLFVCTGTIPPQTKPRIEVADHRSDNGAPSTDIRNVRDLSEIVAHPAAASSRPFIPPGTSISTDGPIGGDPNAPPGVIGVVGGDPRSGEAPPRPPDPPKPVVTRPAVDDTRPLRVASTVLQGKALEKRTPIYPPIAKQIHLQGDVSVEVIIAPDGRVESARVVSGHPMFAQFAKEAALGWRFEPTLLNNVPVRVTGVIVFVFKMNE
jgi:TonB family protein